MFAIAINALYTTLRRHGTTRQLAGAIVTCVVSTLLLLPALVWYNVRFSVEQAALSSAEVGLVLVYVALWGWLVPLSITITYGLFTVPRISNDSTHLPIHYTSAGPDKAGRDKSGHGNSGTSPYAPTSPPSGAPSTPFPFVFGKDTPWGWLEYRNGRFQGQRLALTQSVVRIGREEDNDIWLDDERASRYHAEISWRLGAAYISDNDSLNGVLLNGQAIHGPTIVRQGDAFEVGSHCFLFEYAERSNALTESGDPLQRHMRRMPMTPIPMSRDPSAMTRRLEENGYNPPDKYATIPARLPDAALSELSEPWQETAALDPVAQSSSVPGDKLSGAFVIRSGTMAGRGFLLDRPVLTIGRGVDSDVVINDASISRRHAQVLRQANGDYVQDLASRNGTKVNDEPLEAPRLLQQGDMLSLGEVRMEYTSASTALTTPLSPVPLPPRARSISGPVPLRLPSKPKQT